MVLRLIGLFVAAAVVVAAAWFVLELAEAYVQLFSLVGIKE